jgi:glycosyltransferase involved in cell wall biosynthesis
MPVAIVSVTNDLTTDQRVDRTCRTLVKSGYEVLLVGRRLRHSKTLAPRPYRMHRLRLLFDKGPLFYAEYNTVLFFFLVFHRCDLLVSNDLDTLPANRLAWKIKSLCAKRRTADCKLPTVAGTVRHLHDCHEYFRGMPELNGRKTVVRIWKWIEDRIFPKLQLVVAVNESVAGLYAQEYGVPVRVVRNMPFRRSVPVPAEKTIPGAGAGRRIILYQGAVNIDRGLEEAILAMEFVKTEAVLVIAGIGDIFEQLSGLITERNLTERVILLGEVPFQELHQFTLQADLGLSIEKDVSINYHYCLPNKFLDYIQARVPVLVSPFPEMKQIVDRYQIGDFITSHDPALLAAQFDAMLNDGKRLGFYKKNLAVAAEELCWEREESVLVRMLSGGK